MYYSYEPQAYAPPAATMQPQQQQPHTPQQHPQHQHPQQQHPMQRAMHMQATSGGAFVPPHAQPHHQHGPSFYGQQMDQLRQHQQQAASPYYNPAQHHHHAMQAQPPPPPPQAHPHPYYYSSPVGVAPPASIPAVAPHAAFWGPGAAVASPRQWVPPAAAAASASPSGLPRSAAAPHSLGTSNLLLQRIRAQEDSLRALRHNHAQMVANASPAAVAAAAAATGSSAPPSPAIAATPHRMPQQQHAPYPHSHPNAQLPPQPVEQQQQQQQQTPSQPSEQQQTTLGAQSPSQSSSAQAQHPYVLPHSAATTSKVFIPPLRMSALAPDGPVATPVRGAASVTPFAAAVAAPAVPVPPAAVAPLATASSNPSSRPNTGRSMVALPQSNESATYFALPSPDSSSDGEEGSDGEPTLALLMRVRLDSGVQELAVPRGADAAALASEFGASHSLRPQQIHLLGLAIAQHLELAEQYQMDASAAVSPTQSGQSTQRGNEAQLAATAGAPTVASPARETSTEQPQQQGSSQSSDAAFATAPADAPHEDLARTMVRPSLPGAGAGGDVDGDEDDYGEAEELLMGDSDYTDSTHSRARSRSESRSRSHSRSVSPHPGQTRSSAANANGRSRLRRPPGADASKAAAAANGSKSPSPLRSSSGSLSRTGGRSRSPRFPSPVPPRSPGPFRTQLSTPTRGGGVGASTAWSTLSNATVSDRDILRHLKGAPDLKELERLLQEKQMAEKRRAIAAAAAAAASPGADSSDPAGDQPASPPLELEYGASYAAHLAQTEAAYTRAEKHRAAHLEVAQKHAAWLAQNQNMPFISPRSQSLAASRAERHAEAKRAHDEALAAGQTEEEARAHLDSLSLRAKRAALTRAREEKAATRSFRMGRRSRQLVEDLRANQSSSGPSSAALRMYEEGQRAAAEREAARTAGQERQGVWQTERERDEAENCTFKPQLSALAHLVRPRSPIWRRRKPERDRGRIAVERELAARAEEEAKQLTFKPTINPVSEQLARAKSLLTQSRLKTALVALGSRPKSASSSPARYGTELESMAGMVASDRLYGEAEFRALKAAQRQAQNDEIVQPFHPTLSAHAQPLPGDPRARVAETRRQLKTLAFLEKHRRQLSALGLEGGVPSTPISPTHWGSVGGQSGAPMDWAGEKRRLERLQKEQLKQIHAQFLQRNDDFLARKKEYMQRISSRFQNSEGAYAYDPDTRAYTFRPFFAPQTNARTGAEGAKGQRAAKQQQQQAQMQLQPPQQQDDTSSARTSSLNGSATPQLVSRRSSSLLRSREAERVSLLFTLLDCEGAGVVNSSCAALLDDIPGAQDRKIVAAMFARMDRRVAAGASRSANASRRASISQSQAEEKQQRSASPAAGASSDADSSFYFSADGSLAPIRSDWTLDSAQFADLFAREQKRLVQREGPQGTEGLISGRASVQASRASSGASTPGYGAGGAGGSFARGYCDRRDSFGGAHGRSGSRSAGHSRSTSMDRGGYSYADSSPGRGSVASFNGVAEPASASASLSFTPHIRRKSELLAARNHEQLLAALMWDQHAVGANAGAADPQPASSDGSSSHADGVRAVPVSHPSPALSAVSAASPALRPTAHKRVIRPRARSLSHLHGI